MRVLKRMIGDNYFYNASLSLVIIHCSRDAGHHRFRCDNPNDIFVTRICLYQRDGISARRFIKYPLVTRAFVVARIITARYIEERDDGALR